MPREIVDAEGNKISVPTQEELDAMSTAVKRVSEIEAAQKAAADAWAAEKKELEDQVNPNFRALREKTKLMEKTIADLKAKGQKIDEVTGAIVPDTMPQQISKDEIAQTAKTAAIEVQIGAEVDRHLSKFSSETAQVVRHYFNKLSTGEQLTVGKVAELMAQAQQLAVPNAPAQSHAASGRVPSFTAAGANQVTQTDVEMASAFGVSAEELKKGGAVSPFGWKPKN